MAETRPIVNMALGGWSLGAIIAVLVLVAVLVFWIMGTGDHMVLGFAAALAIARLT